MIGECRRSLNSFDAEIDMAIFLGERQETVTETQIVAQNSSGRVCLTCFCLVRGKYKIHPTYQWQWLLQPKKKKKSNPNLSHPTHLPVSNSFNPNTIY